MTPITTTADFAPVAAAVEVAAAEKMLRDMAYVLKLTRRVKDEMTTDRVPQATHTARKGEGVLVA